MSDFNGYAVFFFPNAMEALGDTIKPYLQDSPGGPRTSCAGTSTSAARSRS